MEDDLKSGIFGMFHAVQVAIRVFSLTHPDPDRLIAAFKREHEESMGILLAQPIPDKALEAYKDFLRGCAPNPDEWLGP